MDGHIGPLRGYYTFLETLRVLLGRRLLGCQRVIAVDSGFWVGHSSLLSDGDWLVIAVTNFGGLLSRDAFATSMLSPALFRRRRAQRPPSPLQFKPPLVAIYGSR
jgi:hypothetical protein